jgi:predicted nucleotidyltransferase
MDRQRTLDNTSLSAIEREALADLRTRLFAELGFVEEVILFGSAARGTADAESDIDLPYRERHQITRLLTEINDHYETNFSSLVIDRSEWEEGVTTVLPIKREIERDGVLV